MNANDVIESYVADVALRLPRKQRNDVAFELRALLTEELQDKALSAGQDADAALAIELVRGFGHPAVVAARYRPALTIIDPADGHVFLRASVIGLAIIWALGLFTKLDYPLDSGWDILTILGHWWGSTVIPSLWWPGVLVVGFALAARSRNREAQMSRWTPRAPDSIRGGRLAVVAGLVGMVCGSYLLINPHWVLDFFWNGNAAPVAYQALTYTESFLHRQGPVLLVLVLLNIPMTIALAIRGRHSALMKRLEVALSVLTCVAMTWAIAGGPILMASDSDRAAKAIMSLIVVVIVVFDFGARLYRSVKPNPDHPFHAPN